MARATACNSHLCQPLSTPLPRPQGFIIVPMVKTENKQTEKLCAHCVTLPSIQCSRQCYVLSVTPRMRDCRNYVISASVCRNCVISRIFGSRHLAKITVFRQSPSCRNHGITAKNSQISAFSWCYWYLVRFMSLVAYRRTALNPLLKHY